jgi:hypothetical protein
MLPLPLFTFRNLAAANLVTVFVYGSLTLGPLAIAIYTREIGGYSAIAAGLPPCRSRRCRLCSLVMSAASPRGWDHARSRSPPCLGGYRAAADLPETPIDSTRSPTWSPG